MSDVFVSNNVRVIVSGSLLVIEPHEPEKALTAVLLREHAAAIVQALIAAHRLAPAPPPTTQPLCSFCEHAAADHARGQMRRTEPCEVPECECDNYNAATAPPVPAQLVAEGAELHKLYSQIFNIAEDVHYRHSEHWVDQVPFLDCTTKRCEAARNTLAALRTAINEREGLNATCAALIQSLAESNTERDLLREQLAAAHEEVRRAQRVEDFAKSDREVARQQLARYEAEIKECSCICHVEKRTLATEEAERRRCPKC